MKTGLEQLTEILCTEPEIEKDIKELRFGCRVTPRNCDYTMYVGHFQDEVSLVNYLKIGTWLAYNVPKDSDLGIIGNPIEERHLRMYLNNKNITFSYGKYGDFHIGKEKFSLNNSKPFHLQEELIQKIVDFLTDR